MSSNKKDVDGGWAWVVLVASFMNLLLASGTAFVSGIFQKLFLEEFGESVAFTAWVTALFASFMQLAGPLSGLLTSVTNCRTTTIIGGSLLATGLAASSFATSLQFLFVTFGLVAGVGLGLMYSPSVVIVNYYFDRLRTVIMGLALSASGIGIIGSPVLSRFLIDEFTWREALLILAAITAHVCVFGSLMLPIHEPTSKCVLLYRRCCGIKGTESDQDHTASAGCGVSESVKCGNDRTCVTPSEGNKQGRSLSGAQTDETADDELAAGDAGISEEQTLLPRKANSAHSSEDHIPNLNGSRANGIPRIAVLSSASHASNNQFGSVKSLSKISHHLNGGTTPGPDGAGRQFSKSAHNIHRLHHANYHHLEDGQRTTANGLLTVEGRGTPKGSRLDVRAVSAYSSIQSLHSLGLPPLEAIVALSPDGRIDKNAEDNDGGGDGVGGDEEEEEAGSDCAIFKNIPFLFLCVNLFFSNMGCGIYNIHLPAFSQQRGLDDYDITFILAMNGLAVFVGRILLGALGNDDRVDKLAVYFGLHLIASFVQTALPVSTTLGGVTAFVLMMGTYYGSVYSLLTSLTISVVGLPRLAFAFGVEMICAGLGYLVAPPLAGWIVDETGDYDNSMYLGGLMMFVSALALLCLSCGRAPGSPSIGYHPPHHTPIEIQVEEETADNKV